MGDQNLAGGKRLVGAKRAAGAKHLALGMFLYALIGLGPALLCYLALLLGLTINLGILLLEGAQTASAGDWTALGGLALICLLPCLTVPLGYRLFLRAGAWIGRAGALYLAWLALSLGLGFAFVSAVAGSSMAVVDGAVNAQELQRQILEQSAAFVLAAQFVIVPWSLLAAWGLGKMRVVCQPLAALTDAMGRNSDEQPFGW